MTTKVNAVSVTVERKTRTSDGAGGYTVELDAITGSPFSCRLIRRMFRSPVLIEGRPADMAVDQIILVFPPDTDIRPNDVCTVSSASYTVTGVRSYLRSVQADVEMVN
jgi:hypothetical protein